MSHLSKAVEDSNTQERRRPPLWQLRWVSKFTWSRHLKFETRFSKLEKSLDEIRSEITEHVTCLTSGFQRFVTCLVCFGFVLLLQSSVGGFCYFA